MEAYTDQTIPIAVGHAAIAWNNLCYSFFQTFELLSRLDSDSAKAVFFVVQSDRSQRNIVGQLIERRLKPKNPKLAKKFGAALEDANKAAAKRNQILHVHFMNATDSAKTSLFHDFGYLKGQKGVELVTAIHKATIETLQLAILVGDLNRQMPAFKTRAIAEVLLHGIPQQVSGGSSSPAAYGLLQALANMQPSTGEDRS